MMKKNGLILMLSLTTLICSLIAFVGLIHAWITLSGQNEIDGATLSIQSPDNIQCKLYYWDTIDSEWKEVTHALNIGFYDATVKSLFKLEIISGNDETVKISGKIGSYECLFSDELKYNAQKLYLTRGGKEFVINQEYYHANQLDKSGLPLPKYPVAEQMAIYLSKEIQNGIETEKDFSVSISNSFIKNVTLNKDDKYTAYFEMYFLSDNEFEDDNRFQFQAVKINTIVVRIEGD